MLPEWKDEFTNLWRLVRSRCRSTQSVQAMLGQSREPNFKGCGASIADQRTEAVWLNRIFSPRQNRLFESKWCWLEQEKWPAVPIRLVNRFT
ncbi:MAG TPA: hypothetical protein DEF45_26000 [Rhodopirellula sp.]|nr:hypothetical protein [Rhodopirellula sp.]